MVVHPCFSWVSHHLIFHFQSLLLSKLTALSLPWVAFTHISSFQIPFPHLLLPLPFQLGWHCFKIAYIPSVLAALLSFLHAFTVFLPPLLHAALYPSLWVSGMHSEHSEQLAWFLIAASEELSHSWPLSLLLSDTAIPGSLCHTFIPRPPHFPLIDHNLAASSLSRSCHLWLHSSSPFQNSIPKNSFLPLFSFLKQGVPVFNLFHQPVFWN